MKILTYMAEYGPRLALKIDRGIVCVRSAAHAFRMAVPLSPAAFFAAGSDAVACLRQMAGQASVAPVGDWLLDEASLTLGPCVPQPGKIFCVGLNYARHARESNLPLPPAPVLFSKFSNAVAAHGENIPLPANTLQYDYEAELCVVIGKKARYVPEDQALEYVLGYCNANDVSARELQTRTSQWLLGKTLDKFLPLGPYLVTPDEAGDCANFPVRCWLNGELRQNSNTSDLIFSVPHLISYISQYMTLEPGDIISTGTPEGVILGHAKKVWMKAGDEMTIEVGPLGKLVNKLVAE